MKVIHSSRLGRSIVVAQDQEEVRRAREMGKSSVYTQREIDLMKGLPAEDLKFIDAAKNILQGTITDVMRGDCE